MTLLWNGRQKKLFGLRDTGNRLVDPYHGKPVAVVEYQAVKELFNQRTKVLWIPYHTVGKQNGCMPGICLDCLFINRMEKKKDRPSHRGSEQRNTEWRRQISDDPAQRADR